MVRLENGVHPDSRLKYSYKRLQLYGFRKGTFILIRIPPLNYVAKRHLQMIRSRSGKLLLGIFVRHEIQVLSVLTFFIGRCTLILTTQVPTTMVSSMSMRARRCSLHHFYIARRSLLLPGILALAMQAVGLVIETSKGQLVIHTVSQVLCCSQP